MKFLKVLPEEEYNLKSGYQSLATVLRACNFIKKRLQHGYVPVSIPKVLGTAFFIEQLWRLLLNYVLVSEKDFLIRKLLERLPLN